MTRYSSREKLISEIETLNKKLEAYERVLHIIRRIAAENANDTYLAEALHKLERVLISIIEQYVMSRKVKSDKLAEAEGG